MMKGTRIRRTLMRAALAVSALTFTGLILMAQDFPGLRGDTGRTGKSSDATTGGPGKANLTWFDPSVFQNFKTIGKENEEIGVWHINGAAGFEWHAPAASEEASFPSTGTIYAPAPYAQTSPYKVGDLVTLTGVVYQCIQDTPELVNPPATSPLFWLATSYPPPYNTGTAYVPGDRVTDGGAVFECIQANTNTATSNTAFWYPLDYSASTTYAEGDHVLFGGQMYVSIKNANVAHDVTDPVYWSSAAYRYVAAEPSAANNPLATDSGLTPATYEWSFTPKASGQYAMYVWLPVGPTDVDRADLTQNYKYSARYYTYQITYGNGLTYTDIVDTFAAGEGKVRLGGGGLPTDRLFQYDGTHPLKITLYNTQPRDSNGVLLESGSNFLVYADAAFVENGESGTFDASPTVRDISLITPGTDIRVVTARNQPTTVTVDGENVTTQKGVVYSYDWNTGQIRWTFSPISTTLSTNFDNNAAGVTRSPGWTAVTTVAGFKGTDYLEAPTNTTSLATADVVTFDPDTALADGEYQVLTYAVGNSGTETFATQATYQIFEGSTQLPDVTIDLSTAGYKSLGTYNHSQLARLRVIATNYSPNVGDATTKVSVDALRFVDTASVKINSSIKITSTPVQAKVNLNIGGVPTPTEVVVVAAENGKIYCLDAKGNLDGTTNVYWVYPTEYDPATGTDPNQVVNEDGNGPIAEMPTGFGKSSGVIGRIGTADYFYIASTNGRVYSIEMAGRGDGTATQTGTTRRAWTFPSDYPQAGETFTVDPSNAADAPGWALRPPPVPTFPFIGANYFDVDIDPALGSAIGVTYTPTTPPLDDGDSYYIDVYVPGDNSGTFASAQRVEVHQGTDVVPFTVDMNASVTNHWIRLRPAAFLNTAAKPLSVVITNNSVSAGDVGKKAYADAVRFSRTTSVATLGSFVGSVALGSSNGSPTVFIGAPQGRVYAVDALGDTVNKTTSITWAYPNLNSPTLGPIYMTPAVDLGKVFVGTARKDLDTGSEFFALNVDTGVPMWSLTGHSLKTYNASGTVTSTVDSINTVSGDTAIVDFDDFVSSPATASATLLGGTNTDTVYFANHNRYIYGMNATDGTLTWRSNELNAVVTAGLSYAPMTVFDNLALGGTETAPTLLIPTSNGRIVGFYAENRGNQFGRKQNYGYVTEAGAMDTNIATGHNFMYAGDARGILYAFSDAGGGNANAPGAPEVVENDPVGVPYRNAKIAFLNDPADYEAARSGNAAKASIVDVTGFKDEPGPFEWGETAYILVYDFPYSTQTPGGTTVESPTVNITISMDGRTLRTVPVRSQKFVAGPVGTDGYAILAFAFQGSGSNSVPPGGGSVTFSISTAALGDPPINRVVLVNNYTPGAKDDARVDFQIANPLGFWIDNSQTFTDTTRKVGADNNTGANLVNGNPNDNCCAAPTAPIAHSQSKNLNVNVYDRSEMFLLRGEGRPGIDNVRVWRGDLEWQGRLDTTYALMKPLPGAYTGFEDLPSKYPNVSLDYPNVQREQVVITKDPGGTPGNPVLMPVPLYPPLKTIGGVDLSRSNVQDRQVRPTPFDFRIRVPQFQPRNEWSYNDKGATNVPAGYRGKIYVVVDSNGNGGVDLANGSREAFREFSLGTQVPPDERMVVTTPTVDLGSLSAGDGVSQTLSPWMGTFKDMFKSFNVTNPGNVNMTNVRLAKGYLDLNATAPFVENFNLHTWPLRAPSVEDNAFIDSAYNYDGSKFLNFNLWSDTDPLLSGIGTNVPVILQKARVGDRVPTNLAVNPRRRPNANTGALGSTGDTLVSGLETTKPRVTVTPPIGTPSGQYSQRLRVIEDRGVLPASDGIYDPNQEFYSDPGFTLKFNVRETRLTTGKSLFGLSMIDDPFGGGTFTRPNIQPAGIRLPNGLMLVAWASPEHDWTTDQPSQASKNDKWRIFATVLDNNLTGGGFSPLSDLNVFNTDPLSTTRWFRHNVKNYPDPATWSTTSEALFGVTGTPLSVDTIKYGAPAFSALGSQNPFDLTHTSTFTNLFMSFVGTAQRDNVSQTESRIFVAPVTFDVNRNVNLGQPVAMKEDPLIRKSKPSIVQVSNDVAYVFYSGAGTDSSQLFWTAYTNTGGGSFSNPMPLNIGNGFTSIGAPSATARTYQGVNYPTLNPILVQNTTPLFEVTFIAKMRGRTNNEVFLARFQPASSTLTPVRLPQEKQERLTAEGQGVFRAKGINWVADADNFRTNPDLIKVEQSLNGVITTLTPSLTLGKTPEVDRNTGVITFDSRLGGKIYLDPSMGTVRFGGATPSPSAVVLLTYTPRIYRVSGNSSAAYSGPSHAFDMRQAADRTYWYTGAPSTGDLADVFDSAGYTAITNASSDRYLFSYGRAASGSGQASRPYMTAMRYGIKLPHAIHTQANGGITLLKVLDAKGPFQVDPVQGAIYFTAADEFNTVKIRYQGADSGNGNALAPEPPTAGTFTDYTVSLVTERRESAVPIEQAVNESFVNLFIDPLNDGYDWTLPVNQRRPGLLWFLWTSTRSGTPDLYFQTLAPKFTPLAVAP